MLGRAAGTCAGGYLHSLTAHDLRRDPSDVHRLFRAAGSPRAAVGLADPPGARPIDTIHDRGDAAAEALFPGFRAARTLARDKLSEDFPHGVPRDHRHHDAAPDVLRDAGQLLV